ncbi:MAG: NUDIX domain-containing protein [Granulosicoccus sp.]
MNAMSNDCRIRVKEKNLLSDQWATLERVRFDYQRNDGSWQEQVREIYHRGHGAAILLYNKVNGSVILVRQFRYPVFAVENVDRDSSALAGSGFLLEVPAGILEEDDAVATIRAEVEQETGYHIGSPEFLFAAYVSPGSVTERIHYFVAPYDSSGRIGTGGGLADEGEDIEVLEMPFDEALSAIADGRIQDAKTIVLLQHAALRIFVGSGGNWPL